MFDIVSKNKTLAFLVSHINTNILNTENDYKDFITIQNNSSYIQQQIKIIKKNTLHLSKNISKHTSNHTYKQTQFKPKNNYTSNTIKTPSIIKKTITNTPSETLNATNSTIPYSKFYTSDQNKIILDENTNIDYIVHAFLMCIDSNFIHTKDNLKKDYIQTLKYKLAVELDTKNLYNEFNYNKIRSLKKTIFQDSLFNNRDIQYINLYRYLGDYFNVNFIRIIDNIFIQHLNEYKDKRIQIIVHQNSSTVQIDTTLYKDEILYSIDYDVSQYINYPGHTFKEYNKLKLKDIQNIALKKNINIKKTSNKNKTKKILIEEILHI